MLFYPIALFFLWLVVRELFSGAPRDGFNLGYMGICLLLAALSLWSPLSTWQLERKLTDVTHRLADFKPTKVKCEGIFESIFDQSGINTAGYANVATGDVVFKAGWCKEMKRYLGDPESADLRAQFSVVMLVHEAMHVRGERNEQRTECQAQQRYYRAARMLGISEITAKKHGILYFNTHFPKHPYYSAECRPNGNLDENLPDSLWNYLDSA